jgi:alpha-ketoglutarate-dependent taurine dioxygenase
MTLEIVPLNETFGAEVRGLDLSRPMTAELKRQIETLYYRYSILLFRGNDLTPDQQIAFSRDFGDLNIHVHQRIVPGKAEVIVLSNLLDENGNPVGSFNCALSWHTDGTHLTKPVTTSMLYCVVAPEAGGETEFAGTAQAYDDLPADLKAFIDDKRAIHSYVLLAQRSFPDRPIPEEKRQQIPDILQPIVRVHPVTGRRALYLGEHVIAGVEGLPAGEGVALITRLREHATQPRYVYRHRWQPGDMLMWDNRCTLHRATFLDHATQRRRLHRTTVNGTEHTGIPVREGMPAAELALNPLR